MHLLRKFLTLTFMFPSYEKDKCYQKFPFENYLQSFLKSITKQLKQWLFNIWNYGKYEFRLKFRVGKVWPEWGSKQNRKREEFAYCKSWLELWPSNGKFLSIFVWLLTLMLWFSPNFNYSRLSLGDQV